MQRKPEYLPRVAFWLVPQQPDREVFQSLIIALAKRFSSPLFVPHITVYSCRRTSGQQELGVAAGLAERCRCLSMRSLGLASTSMLARTLFLNLQQDHELTSLCQSLHGAVQNPSNYSLAPHMSLLYQTLSVTEREALVDEIIAPLHEIRFSELWVMAIPEKLTCLDDYYGWQPLMICHLLSR